jgi:hypothetical protein
MCAGGHEEGAMRETFAFCGRRGGGVDKETS